MYFKRIKWRVVVFCILSFQCFLNFGNSCTYRKVLSTFKGNQVLSRYKLSINSNNESADQVIIHVGSNDISKGIKEEVLVQNIELIGKHLVEMNPGVRVTISSIFLQKYKTTKNFHVVEANYYLNGFALQRDGTLSTIQTFALSTLTMVVCISHLKATAYSLETLQIMLVGKDLLEDVCNCNTIDFKSNNKSALAIGSQRTRSKNGLLIASLNINGLRHQLGEINLLLWEINVDILTLNETKLNASYPEQLTATSAYEKVQQKRNSMGGGASVYI